MPGRVPSTGLDRPGSSLAASPASPASSSWLEAVSAILTRPSPAAARESWTAASCNCASDSQGAIAAILVRMAIIAG
jgi:hypothetical protein